MGNNTIHEQPQIGPGAVGEDPLNDARNDEQPQRA
jgi:hypothetical protein